MRHPQNHIIVAGFITVLLAGTTQAQRLTDSSNAPWEGEVIGTNVYVRCGAATNFYPTTKLNTGDRVLVLGEKSGWYRIVPPVDSFSYIDTAMVERMKGTSLAAVTRKQAAVRAGSHLVSRKSITQTTLNKGAMVEIIGESDGFYKIKPPRGATLFISSQYVRKVPRRLATGLLQRWQNRARQKAEHDKVKQKKSNQPSSATIAQPNKPVFKSPRTDVLTNSNKVVASDRHTADGTVSETRARPFTPARIPSRRSTNVSKDGPPIVIESSMQSLKHGDKISNRRNEPAESQDSLKKEIPAAPKIKGKGRSSAILTTIESDLLATMRRRPSEQDLTSLILRYKEIADQESDQISSQYAKARIDQLKNMIRIHQAQTVYATESEALETLRNQMSQERMKIMRVRAEAAMVKYDLEGELRKSYAFAPEKRRYRLIDPAKRTTIAYVDVPRNVTENVEHMIGRLVGIRVSSRHYSEAARIPIAVAASIVDLTPRSNSPGVIIPSHFSSDPNSSIEMANSSQEATGKENKASEPKKTAVASGSEEQDQEK